MNPQIKHPKIILLTMFSFCMANFSGCVSSVVLDTSKNVSQTITQLNQSLKDYEKVLEKDSGDQIERIASARVRIHDHQFVLDQGLQNWKVSDRKKALELYEGIQELIEKALNTTVGVDQIKSEQRKLLETQKKYSNQRKALAALAKKVQEMSEPRELKEEGRFLFDFAGRAQSSIEKLQNNEARKEQPKNPAN